MDIYLVRHGETDWNKARKVQGSTDIPLNEYGIELAKITFKGLDKEGISFDYAFTSPYIRAVKTAEILLSDSPVSAILDSRIRELGFGAYEGAYIPEIDTNKDYEGIKDCFSCPESYKATKGAESFEQLFERINAFWNEKILPLEGSCHNVLITCHGAVIRAFLSIFNHMELKDYWTMHQYNCAVNRIHVEDGKASVCYENRLYYSL